MATQNDFLTFACGDGANVLDQAAYAAASATDTGYVTGTASSSAVNKTLRQTSIMAAMIAKFIFNEAGADVIDDGTTDTILANFEQAILEVAGGRVIQISDVVNLTDALAGKLSTLGNAASASKLNVARAISLSGIISGTTNFDGSAGANIITTIADAALTIAKTSGLQSALDAKASLASPPFSGNPTAPTRPTSDNSTSIANTAFVRALFGSLVQQVSGGISALGFKFLMGFDTCPPSHAQQATRAVNFPTTFSQSPFAIAFPTSNSHPTQGPIVCYSTGVASGSGVVFGFDIAEGQGASPIINNSIPYVWFAAGF